MQIFPQKTMDIFVIFAPDTGFKGTVVNQACNYLDGWGPLKFRLISVPRISLNL